MAGGGTGGSGGSAARGVGVGSRHGRGRGAEAAKATVEAPASSLETNATSTVTSTSPTSARFSNLYNYRRVVVHPQFLLAIGKGEKRVEFRSTAVSIPYFAGLRLLFSLGAC